MKKLKPASGGYRADRRNAARKAGTLSEWRKRPRIRSHLSGKQSENFVHSVAADGTPVYATRIRIVYTYVAGI